MRLLDGLSETTRGEVHFTAETLGLVVSQPVLEERGAVRSLDTKRFSNTENTYFRGAGHKALNRNPSRACTMANSRVNARTAPLLAVYANWGVALPTKATTLAVLIMLPFVFL